MLYRFVTRAVFLLGLVLNSETSAFAQKANVEPERLAAAVNLLKATGAAKNFDAVVPLMIRQISKVVKASNRGKEAIVDEVFAKMRVKFGNRKQELIDQIAALYAQEMTAADMNEISAFYSSGAGARFVALQPKLIGASSKLGQAWGQKIGRELVGEVRQELRKRGVGK